MLAIELAGRFDSSREVSRASGGSSASAAATFSIAASVCGNSRTAVDASTSFRTMR